MGKKQTNIKIGVHILENTIDLQIPIQVSVGRLKELLLEVLPALQSFTNGLKIKVLNKPISLNDSMLVSSYPLANGDQIEITENEE